MEIKVLNKWLYVACLSSLVTVELAANDNPLALELELISLAKYTCASEIKEGVDYETTKMVNGSVEFKLLGRKGGELGGTYVFNKDEWKGQQKVLIEDRAKLQSEYQSCVVNQTNLLRNTHVVESSNENSTTSVKDNLPAEIEVTSVRSTFIIDGTVELSLYKIYIASGKKRTQLGLKSKNRPVQNMTLSTADAAYKPIKQFEYRDGNYEIELIHQNIEDQKATVRISAR